MEYSDTHTFYSSDREPWCVSIMLVDDYAVETVEYFTVTLSTSQHSIVNLFPLKANVTVTDGDGKLSTTVLYNNQYSQSAQNLYTRD